MLTSNMKIKNINILTFDMVTKHQLMISKTKTNLLHLKLNVILQFIDERQIQEKVKFSILNLSQLHPDSGVPVPSARGSHIKHPINRVKRTREQRVPKIASKYQRGLASNFFLKLSCCDLKLGKHHQNRELD